MKVEITEEQRLEALRRLWRKYHTYPFVASHWSPERAKQWFERWMLDIPNLGCSCLDHWKELNKTLPPDFTCRAAFFQRSVEHHNEVNQRKGKPVLTVQEAKRANALFDNGKFVRTNDKLSIGFVASCFNKIGGTETWHRTLIPRLANEFNVTALATEDPNYYSAPELGCVQAGGFDACAATIAQSDVTIAWGVNMTHMLSPGCKLVAVDHGDMKANWFMGLIEQQQDILSHVVAVNAEVASYARSVLKCPVTHIPNAVSTERIRVTEDVRATAPWLDGKKVCLWSARISKEKQVDLAVEAALHLPKDWVLVIVGGKEDKELPPNVHAIGALPSQANWLAVADVFLSTASFEGFGLSMAEAMLAGVPVVATPCGIGARAELCSQIRLDASPSEIAHVVVNADRSKVPVAQSYVATEHSIDRAAARWAALIQEVHHSGL